MVGRWGSQPNSTREGPVKLSICLYFMPFGCLYTSINIPLYLDERVSSCVFEIPKRWRERDSDQEQV